MKTGAIKVCRDKNIKMFQSRILMLNQKHEAIKKCKVGKVAVKYFESDFVEK